MNSSAQPDQASDVLVKIRDLRFSRGSRKIFDGVDIDLCRGKVTAIMGPSGTGKTTLLRLIGGQLKPDQGVVEVDGEEVSKLSRGRLFELRKRMGMLFQSGALLTDISVFDNVAYPIREHTQLPENLIRNLVLMKLQAVGLRGAHILMPSELSGGMATGCVGPCHRAGPYDGDVRRTFHRPRPHFDGCSGAVNPPIERCFGSY